MKEKEQKKISTDDNKKPKQKNEMIKTNVHKGFKDEWTTNAIYYEGEAAYFSDVHFLQMLNCDKGLYVVFK